MPNKKKKKVQYISKINVHFPMFCLFTNASGTENICWCAIDQVSAQSPVQADNSVSAVLNPQLVLSALAIFPC